MSSPVAAHEASGRRFSAAGVESFVLDQGEAKPDAAPIVLMHGVPASSYLYRKVIPELAQRGHRALAFDLPGLGLAARPEAFDYSFTGLGRWATAAVDALDLNSFHLVVHDVGGPVGFELASAMPERIQSLTVLNTLIDVQHFQKPWSMRPFGVPGLNQVWLASTRIKPVFRQLMYMQGVADKAKVPKAELDGYIELLHRGDGGKAFLQIMSSFETTPEKSALYTHAAKGAPDERGQPRYPVQVVWGEQDPALRYESYGRIAEQITGTQATKLPGRHFFQEDCAPELAAAIDAFVRGA